MVVRWLGGGKITHRPEKSLWWTWSKILWHNHKSTLVGTNDAKKSHVTSSWRQYDVIIQKTYPRGRKSGKSGKNNFGRKNYRLMIIDPSFFVFLWALSGKIHIIDIQHEKGIKISKKRKSRFPISADNRPVFSGIPVTMVRKLQKTCKTKFCFTIGQPGPSARANFSNFAFSRSVGNFTPPPNHNRVKGRIHYQGRIH